MIVLPVNIFIRKQVIFMTINDLKDKVISGGLITIDDALFLSEADLDDLCKYSTHFLEMTLTYVPLSM